MVTDQYSHILDDDRKHNADLFEQAFYSGKGAEAVSGTLETVANAEMAALLKALAANIK